MLFANTWHKFYLHRRKIIVLCLLLVSITGFAQKKSRRIFNPNYDDRRKITYGFSIGIHNTYLGLKYSDLFVTAELDTVHSILPPASPGFSLGFIVNWRAADLLDVRLTPRVSFNEYRLNYYFTDNTSNRIIVENTMVEFPLLAKFKSERRGNFRMYVVGGVSPAFDASGKNDLEDTSSGINFRKGNLSFEMGFGLDIYYPLFKFSPELRYSKGIINTLGEQNDFSLGINRLSTNIITLFLLFQ